MSGCYKPVCDHEVEISCSCTDPPTLSCQEHLIEHCQTSFMPHDPTSVFLNLVEGTKEAMLSFFTEQKSKNAAIKIKIFTSFHQTIFNLIKMFERITKEIDSDSTNLDSYFITVQKAEKVSRLEKDSVLAFLTLQPNESIEKAKALLLTNKNFDLFENMKSLIDQAISNFNDEKPQDIQGKSILKLENNELNVDKEARNTQQALNKNKETIEINQNMGYEWNNSANILKNEKNMKKRYNITMKQLK